MVSKMGLSASFLILLILCVGSFATPKRFDNYRVYSLKIENEAQRELIDGLWLSNSLDYWKGSNTINASPDIMVAPEDQEKFESALVSGEFKWQLKVENVQDLIDNEQPKVKPRADMEWESYHTLDEIFAWMDDLLVQYPDILSDVRYGFSVEGRPLRGIKLSKRVGNSAVLIEANTHAREWITAATATHFLNELLTSQEGNTIFLANNLDWIIIPVMNPDGYVYTFESNRMWRKNRARHGLICLGVDPNRNWGYQWATDAPGSSANVCDETYSGPEAFSEPEVKLLADLMDENPGYIKMFLSFHSYSQLLLYPWSYSAEPPEDVALLAELALIVADGIRGVHGTVYTPQSSYGLYPHHGTSVDWTYGYAGITLSLTFEFRDTGAYGFVLPADQIIPNAQEAKAGIIAYVQEAVARGLLPLYIDE